MSSPVEYIIFWTSFLLLLSIAISKAVSKFAIPGLIIFVLLGMIVGSEGPGGVYFDDPWETELIGTFALVIIIFSGGLQTKWSTVRPVFWEGTALSLAGVFLTALLAGGLTSLIFNIPLIKGFLLGAILSSTDAPAVFALLRAKSMKLKPRLRALLEFESGSNDPMAVILTIGTFYFISHPATPYLAFFLLLGIQIFLGIVIGWLLGQITVFTINKLKLEYEGLYHVLVMAAALLAYSLTTILKGSGFLAIYIMGIVMGQKEFHHKNGIINYHDGLSWLLQIAMFLIMGLLAFPSHLLPFIKPALLIALLLLFIARPASVFLTLSFSKMDLREKTMISWVGMRGAVPIILAVFLMNKDTSRTQELFNCVFCVVLISVLIQGTTIPVLARLLKLESPLEQG